MPAACAARALANSPFGQNRPASPVGPITKGMLSRLPNRSIDRSRVAAPLSGIGNNSISPNTASLRRSVRSSSAPPSAKSKIGFGNAARASSRIAAML